MKILDKIKSIFKNDNKVETEKIIITQKTCPHCVSRGMFVFNDNAIAQVNSTNSNLMPNVSLSLSKTDHHPK